MSVNQGNLTKESPLVEEQNKPKTSSLQSFFEREITFGIFSAQVCTLAFLAWLSGYLGFSVAWCLFLAYSIAKYWNRIVDLFATEQVALVNHSHYTNV